MILWTIQTEPAVRQMERTGASWLNVLQDDKRAIFTAAAHAQRAVDFLHGLQDRAAETAAA